MNQPFDSAAIRQILQSRAMGVAPQAPEEIDPAVLQQFAPTDELGPGGRSAPVPDMPIDPSMVDPEQAMNPQVMLEMEKQRVKDSLKQVRDKELMGEIEALIQARRAEIDGEANELFSQGK